MLVKPPSGVGRRKNVRRIIRRSFRQPGRLGLGENSIKIKSVNMSVGGMGFLSPRALAVGTPCTVSIAMKEKDRTMELQANGTVVYSMPSGARHYRCGIAFSDNNERTIAQIVHLTLIAPTE